MTYSGSMGEEDFRENIWCRKTQKEPAGNGGVVEKFKNAIRNNILEQ